MNPDIFTPEEEAALKRSVSGIRLLPIYDDPEFSEIFGLTKDELTEVEESFPNWDLYDEGATGFDDSGSAVKGAFAWIMNGKEEEKEMMRKHIGQNEEFIHALYSKVNEV